jgi:hypothetical protein
VDWLAQAGLARPSTGRSREVIQAAGFAREKLADYDFDGNFPDVNFAHGQFAHQRLARRNDLVAFDL